MSIDRESVYAALFSLITGNVAFVTTSRKFVDIIDCDAALQPALYQREANMLTSEKTVGLPSYNVRAWWFVYMQCSPDSGTLPETALNALIKVAMDILEVPEGQFQTLNNTPQVMHAYINGEMYIYPGLLPGDTKAFAVIPISILCGT